MHPTKNLGGRAPIYLDLFEDGLYAQAASLGDATRHDQLLNDLRFHAALAILFDRPLAVPEPWFTSSHAFLRVAKEILTAYKPAVAPSEATGRMRAVSFPFKFQHFGSNESQGARIYLRALQGRLLDGRQVLLTPAFGEIGKTPTDEERSRRLAVARSIELALVDPDFGGSPTQLADLTRKIADGAATSAHEDEALNLGADLKALLTALAAEPETRNHFDPINSARMGVSFRNFEREIQRVVRRGGIEEFIHPDLLHDYREMFQRLPGSDQGSLVNRYLRYLKSAQISEASKEFIWSTGRFAIHNAYADAISPLSLTISSKYYCSADTDSEVHSAFHNLVGFVAPLASTRAVRNDDGAADIPLASYDMANAIPWDRVWKEIYDIAANPSWMRFRKDISQAIRCERREHSDAKYWREIFDRVNDQVQTIVFGTSGGYRLAVARRALSEHADDVVRAAKGSEVVVAGGSEAVFSLVISGLKALVGVVNNRVSGPTYFNGVRLGVSMKAQMNRILSSR